MEYREKHFIQKCLDSEELWINIDDYVDEWHESDTDMELFEFLGMSQLEYAIWVEKPFALKYIIFCRKYDTDLLKTMSDEQEYQRLAARAGSLENYHELHEWLKNTGRI